MDDLIANIRNFSRLDFQAKQEVIKNGRTTRATRFNANMYSKGTENNAFFPEGLVHTKGLALWLCIKKTSLLLSLPFIFKKWPWTTSKGKTKTVWVYVSVCITLCCSSGPEPYCDVPSLGLCDKRSAATYTKAAHGGWGFYHLVEKAFIWPHLPLFWWVAK